MQASSPPVMVAGVHNFRRGLRFFLLAPMVTLVIVIVAVAVAVTAYRQRHENRVYTGVSAWGIDLGRLQRTEAERALATAFSGLERQSIVLSDPASGRQWSMTPQELGLSYDAGATTDTAYGVGRDGGTVAALWQTVTTWYYGRSLAPTIVLDEGKLAQVLDQLATEIERPAVNARVEIDGNGSAGYTPGQIGRRLDVEETRERLVQAILARQPVNMELLVHDVKPAIYDRPEEVRRIRSLVDDAPMTLYLEEPLADDDLGRVILPEAEIISWLRVEVMERADGGGRHRVFLDENAAREWLAPRARELFRKPERARFYFDDNTGQLVLVEPHVDGRQVDVETTLSRLLKAAETSVRSVPFVVEEITPTVSSTATAEALGITELVSQGTTWFRGSSDARKHNIAQAAANFFGLVIAPGEEFSFNRYLGEVTEDDGYEEGLIIIGGQTIAGIGGGVCQVSTTVFQTVFYAGFPVTERWQHGYMLDYYNDGEGPGMDATVYSPIVDFRFVNNTPYHLLIENYYNEAEESLTFKFYSTDMGRRVEKSGPVFEDIVPAPPAEEDAWTFDEDLAPGTVRQIDWATEGATVTVGRTVTNADGEVIIEEEFVSEYVPWPNGYQYGPGVEAPDYSLVP